MTLLQLFKYYRVDNWDYKNLTKNLSILCYFHFPLLSMMEVNNIHILIILNAFVFILSQISGQYVNRRTFLPAVYKEEVPQ
jgi:hypothetical protein